MNNFENSFFRCEREKRKTKKRTFSQKNANFLFLEYLYDETFEFFQKIFLRGCGISIQKKDEFPVRTRMIFYVIEDFILVENDNVFAS